MVLHHAIANSKAMKKTPDKIYTTGYSSIGGDRNVDPVLTFAGS